MIGNREQGLGNSRHARRIFRLAAGWLAISASIAGCGSGDELREATERRRQAQAEFPGDSAAGDTTIPGRLPAFINEDSVMRADTGRAADTATAPQQQDSLPQEWTVGATRVRKQTPGVVVMRGLRVGVNQGFDRLVLDFGGDPIPAYVVEYVDEPMYQCGSGDPVRLAGDATLAVTLHMAQAHDEAGRGTAGPRQRRLSMPVLRELVFTCDFEGEVQIAAGASAPNPYRVVELSNPSRLIIDIRQ